MMRLILSRGYATRACLVINTKKIINLTGQKILFIRLLYEKRFYQKDGL